MFPVGLGLISPYSMAEEMKADNVKQINVFTGLLFNGQLVTDVSFLEKPDNQRMNKIYK
jgi:hypothetical protein